MNNNTPTNTTTATGREPSHVREQVKALIVSAQNGGAAGEAADEILALVRDELQPLLTSAASVVQAAGRHLVKSGLL